MTRESGRSRDGWGGGEDGPTLDPHDLRVGHAVVLMNRPMLVCGWEEAAHVWWENVTGEKRAQLKVAMMGLLRLGPQFATSVFVCTGLRNVPWSDRAKAFQRTPADQPPLAYGFPCLNRCFPPSGYRVNTHLESKEYVRWTYFCCPKRCEPGILATLFVVAKPIAHSLLFT